jgi:hypothetical protein
MKKKSRFSDKKLLYQDVKYPPVVIKKAAIPKQKFTPERTKKNTVGILEGRLLRFMYIQKWM